MNSSKQVLLFNYFQGRAEGHAAYHQVLNKSIDLVAAINDFANAPQHTVPYVIPTMIHGAAPEDFGKVMDVQADDVTAYPLLIDGRQRIYAHGFTLVFDRQAFSRRFDPVFEIRVQNDDGEWQDWQAITGRFVIAKVHPNLDFDKLMLENLTVEDVAMFR